MTTQVGVAKEVAVPRATFARGTAEGGADDIADDIADASINQQSSGDCAAGLRRRNP